MKQEDVPKAWRSRCTDDGHKRYIDGDGNRRYVDTDEIVGESDYRPCAKCGHYPVGDGDDYCLGHLGNVMNACCGHGTHEGYIQFDNGITVRGYFTIENNNK